MDFAAMAQLCAPDVAVGTLSRIASVESSFNPYAIGVVGARLQRQPKNLEEAVATAKMLKASGYNYSLGLIQVNQANFAKHGLSDETAFDPCNNLRAGGLILQDCFKRAGGRPDPLGDALSCYYSGNFSTGYRAGYVAKVKAVEISGVAVPPPTLAIPVVATKGRQTKARPVAATPASTSDPMFITRPAVASAVAEIDPPRQGQRASGNALLF